MCDSQRIRFASSPLRLHINIENHLKENGAVPKGFFNFVNEEDMSIFIIYGKSDYAMTHDIINNKYTFCIFPDYIFGDENDCMEIFRITLDIVKTILSYIYPPMSHKIKPKYIKDNFASSIEDRIRHICAYNVWTIFGDRFLDKYKEKFPEDKDDIESIIDIFDQVNE
jgi:hypothetical protein